MHVKSLVNVIAAGPSDAQTVATLGRETFYESWRPFNSEEDLQHYLSGAFAPESIREELATATNTFLLAVVENKDAGYAKLRRDRTPGGLEGQRTLEIERMYVRRHCQRMRVGAALMEHCIALAESEDVSWLWLGVDTTNRKAIAFYERFGFTVFGTKQFHLGNAVNDDYLMKRAVGLPG